MPSSQVADALERRPRRGQSAAELVVAEVPEGMQHGGSDGKMQLLHTSKNEGIETVCAPLTRSVGWKEPPKLGVERRLAGCR